MNKKIALSFIAYSLFATTLTCVGSEGNEKCNLQLALKTAGQDRFSIGINLLKNNTPVRVANVPINSNVEACVVIPADMKKNAPYIYLKNSAGSKNQLLLPKEDISDKEIESLKALFSTEEKNQDVLLLDYEKNASYNVIGLLQESELTKFEPSMQPMLNPRSRAQFTTTEVNSQEEESDQEESEKPVPKKVSANSGGISNSYFYSAIALVVIAVAVCWKKYPEALQSFFARFTSFNFSRLPGLLSVSRQ